MKGHLPLIFLIVFLSSACHSGKQALKLIDKQKYDKAQSKLNKALTKDSLNADLYYVYALLYTDTAYSGYDIDSSFFYIKKSLQYYASSDIKTKTKLQAKMGIDSLVLMQQKLLTDTLAYQRAENENTVQSYQFFLDEHPLASQQEEAIQNRNQLAFDAASALDTYEDYKNFMDTYPDALQYIQARERYNTLAFRENTREGNLKSYLDFLQAFPDSPFRPQAEGQILQITTAANDFEAYENFIKQYPQSTLRRFAVNILYHLYREKYSSEAFFERYARLPFIDSLRKAAEFEQAILAPVFENQHYGLMNGKSGYVIGTTYDLIPPSYFCEGISGQIVHLAKRQKDKTLHQVLTKSGTLVHEYRLPLRNREIPENLERQKIHEIGAGLLLIENDQNKYCLFHQSGQTIYPSNDKSYPLDTAVLVGSVSPSEEIHEFASFQFIKIKENGLWGIISFSGRVLLEPLYEEIEAYGNFLAITKDGRTAVSTRAKLIGAANQLPLELSFLYDDVALVDQKYIIAYDDDRESALDLNLNIVVPLGRQNIIRPIGGLSDEIERDKQWLIREDKLEAFVRNDSLLNRNKSVYYIYDQETSNQPKEIYQKAYFNSRWMALQNKDGFHFYDFQNTTESKVYDSVKLVGENFALLFESYPNAKDSVKVLFQNGGILSLVSPERLDFLLLKPNIISAGNSREYILVAPKNGPKEVWSQDGKRILQGKFDNLSIYPSTLFVIDQGGKKGILDSLGNELVPVRYQGISNYQDSMLAIFQNKKFGAYHFPSKTLIEPRYDAVLQSYGQPVYNLEDSSRTELFIARNGNGYGLINQENTPLTDFIFDEIQYWNDTSALVRQDDEWSIYRFSRQEKFDKIQQYIVYGGIITYSLLDKFNDEKVIKIYKKEGYGMLSNRKGEILPPTYDDVRLLGSIRNPGSMYLSEKYVPEADLYMVMHLDLEGKLIKRQALTSAQYDMVFCDE